MLLFEFDFNLFLYDLFFRNLQVLQEVDRLVDVNQKLHIYMSLQLIVLLMFQHSFEIQVMLTLICHAHLCSFLLFTETRVVVHENFV